MSVNALSGSYDTNAHAMQGEALNQGADVGQLQGMEVQCDKSPQDALADSAEELTFVRDNSKQTKLANRKQRARGRPSVDSIKRMQQAQRSVLNADSAQMNKVIEEYARSIKRKNSRDSQDLLSDLEDLGDHSSTMWAFLLGKVEEVDDPEVKDFLQKTADLLYDTKKSEINAVINTLSAMEGQQLAAPLQLSQTYSELAAEHREPESILTYLKTKYGDNEIKQGIDLMFKALSADLQAATPSHDTEVLNDLASCLGKARVLNASMLLANDFVSRIGSVLQLENRLDAGKLLNELVSLSSSRFVSHVQIQQLYKSAVQTHNPEEDVLVAQELMRTVRNLPVEIYADEAGRMRVMDAAQKLIDDLVDKEDAWLDAGGQ